jgi:hypothetical protein
VNSQSTAITSRGVMSAMSVSRHGIGVLELRSRHSTRKIALIP